MNYYSNRSAGPIALACLSFVLARTVQMVVAHCQLMCVQFLPFSRVFGSFRARSFWALILNEPWSIQSNLWALSNTDWRQTSATQSYFLCLVQRTRPRTITVPQQTVIHFKWFLIDLFVLQSSHRNVDVEHTAISFCVRQSSEPEVVTLLHKNYMHNMYVTITFGSVFEWLSGQVQNMSTRFELSYNKPYTVALRKKIIFVENPVN